VEVDLLVPFHNQEAYLVHKVPFYVGPFGPLELVEALEDHSFLDNQEIDQALLLDGLAAFEVENRDVVAFRYHLV